MSDLAIVNALGSGREAVLANLLQGDQSGMTPYGPLLTGRNGVVGRVEAELPPIPEALAEFDCRNNQLLAAAAAQQADRIEALKSRYGRERIAVILGTSTSGIAEGEVAVDILNRTGSLPNSFDYRQQEIGAAAEFLARYSDVSGPRYTISTACSSSAKVFAAGQRLLDADFGDAVIAGGSDSLCKLTTNGFDALEAMAPGICNPFSINREGINIGEGAALLLMSRDEGPIRLLGVGESSDAWHMSAPEPSGKGAELAIRGALDQAALAPQQVGYINLHGTATPKNDEMESCVVNRVFGPDVPCSSTKSQIGHTLGAAGAQEVGLCWLLLDDLNVNKQLPMHLWDGAADPDLATIGLTVEGDAWQQDVCMSNSFAFGGSNVCVIIGRS
ncbi:MAG: beta-ketoacyl-[acyl-carrier-protein] synthase family protein [Woeseiaceae bacterium]